MRRLIRFLSRSIAVFAAVPVAFRILWFRYIRPPKPEPEPEFTLDDATEILRARVHAVNPGLPKSQKRTENPKKLRRMIREATKTPVRR